MNTRKDMGELPSEVVPPTRTGKRSVVAMTIEVFVEVAESDDYNDMVNQAKDQLNRRVVEGHGFYPVSARANRIHTNMKVDDLKHRTYVDPTGQW